MKHKLKRIFILSILPLALSACDVSTIQAWGNERGISITDDSARRIAEYLEYDRASSVPDMIVQKFAGTGHEGKALRIAKCESGFNPMAKNSRSSASGVFQIIRDTWNAHASPGMSVFNARHNIEVAHRIWLASGKSWRQWQCKA